MRVKPLVTPHSSLKKVVKKALESWYEMVAQKTPSMDETSSKKFERFFERI